MTQLSTSGVLAFLDQRDRRTAYVMTRVSRIAKKYNEETMADALDVLEHVMVCSETVLVPTWEHSSVTAVGDSGVEMMPPEGVPQDLFNCLVDLLFDNLIVDGLQVMLKYRFLMSPSVRANRLAIWKVPADQIEF